MPAPTMRTSAHRRACAVRAPPRRAGASPSAADPTDDAAGPTDDASTEREMPTTPRRVSSTAEQDRTTNAAWERSLDIVSSALSRMDRAVPCARTQRANRRRGSEWRCTNGNTSFEENSWLPSWMNNSHTFEYMNMIYHIFTLHHLFSSYNYLHNCC